MFPEKVVGEMNDILDVIDNLAIHERYIVAGNPNSPEAVLERLAADESANVRRHVAENPSTPTVVLMELAGDVASEVRLGVAENPRTPLPILEVLAQDDCIDVRFGIAENAHAPEYLLNILTRDDNPFVACRARHTVTMINRSRRFPGSIGQRAYNHADNVHILLTTWQRLPQIRPARATVK